MLQVGADNGLSFANYSPALIDVLAVAPEPYLHALARVAAQARDCMGQPLISAALALGIDRLPGGLRHPVAWSIMPPNEARGEAVMGNPQRLNDTEQLEILGLLEAVSIDPSAVRAARALAELMRHVNALGERIALELPDHHIARSLNRD